MSRKNNNKSFADHSRWNVPKGVRTLSGEPLEVHYHTSPTNDSECLRRRKTFHNNAMRKLRAKQQEMTKG